MTYYVVNLRKLASSDAKKLLIETMSVSETEDYRTKTGILLKALEDEASISEFMLDIFEILEQVLLDASNPITTTMKSAYCRVAVECTLKSYPKAVDRIWKARVPPLATHGSHLFSDDLKYWKTQFQNGYSDINNFLSLPDTTPTLQMFLDEAWDNLLCAHSPPQIVTQSEQQRQRRDMYAAIVDDGSTDTTTSCSKLEDMNQEAQSEYHNANAYVPNSQHHCQIINNNQANLNEGGTTSNPFGVVTLHHSKRNNFSPFKDHDPTKLKIRRRINKWSQSEVNTLRAGVLKFGRDWKTILNFYGFRKRTAVDLKDKWTNILKSEAKQNKGK